MAVNVLGAGAESLGGGSIFIMAVGRYFVWSSQGWSLFLMFGFIFVPGLISFAFTSYMFFREVHMRIKHGENFKQPRTSSVKEDTGVFSPDPSKSLISMVGPENDEKGEADSDKIMSEFINKTSDGRV